MTAFDCPMVGLQNKPFEVRYRHLLSQSSSSNPMVISYHLSSFFSFLFFFLYFSTLFDELYIVAARLLCNKDTKINYLVQQIIDDGGEGAIIRKFGSFYDPGRSQSLLKLKVSLPFPNPLFSYVLPLLCSSLKVIGNSDLSVLPVWTLVGLIN